MNSCLRAISLASMMALVLALSGCGGGGGGGGPSGPRFSLSTHSLTFSASSPGAYVPPQSIGATVTDVSGGTVYFLIQLSGTAVQTVTNVTITGPTSGVADVIPANSASLGSGTHRGTITVVACVNDPSCTSGVLAGSPQVVDVTYQVGGVVTNPAAANFSVVEGSVPSAVDINVSGALVSGALTTSVNYASGAPGWLSVTPASASSLPAALRLTAASLPAGSYSAVLSLTAGGLTLPFPVNYTVLSKLAASSSTVSFAAVRGQVALPAPMVVAVTAPGSSGAVSFSSSVSYGAGATGWLNVTGNSAPGNLTIVPNTTDLTPGATYTAAVSLTPSGGGSPSVVSVSYTVASSVLTLSSTSQSFGIDVFSTTADQFIKRIVTTADTGAPLSWTAVSSAPWVSVTGSGASGDAAVLTLVPAALGALPNGVSNAMVTFSYTGAGGASGLVSLGVTVNVNLPTLTYVAPYTAKANTPGSLILRGQGFNALGGRALAIGNTTVPTYTVISDSEIRVAYPALAAGTYPVKFATPLDIGSAVNLVLFTPPAYSAEVLAYPNVSARQPLRVIYDAERNALIVAVAYPTSGSGGDILRYSYSGTSWGAPIPQFVPTFRDLSITPNGKKLIALSQSAVAQFDAVTLAAGPLTNATFLFAGFEYLKSVAMTNDGKAIVTSGVFGSGATPTKAYDVSTASFDVGSSFSAFVYDASATASADGSRVFLAHGGGISPPPEQMYYDASFGVLAGTGIHLNVPTEAMLDRSGSRIVLNGQQVFNGNFLQIGSIPCGVGVLAPDGSRAYCYDWFGDGRLHTFDLTVAPIAGVFPEIGTALTLAGNPGLMPKMTISPDGNTVFVAGDAAIVVQPVP
jgi:hypothetical protein